MVDHGSQVNAEVDMGIPQGRHRLPEVVEEHGAVLGLGLVPVVSQGRARRRMAQNKDMVSGVVHCSTAGKRLMVVASGEKMLLLVSHDGKMRRSHDKKML
jgi:hypothetical protein